MRQPRERSGGFTLVELMIAFTLLAIGLLSLAAMQLTALEYGSRGRHQTRAAAIAEEKMEQLMRLRWDNAGLAPTAWTVPEPVTNVVQGAADSTEQTYERSWRIANLDAGRTRTIDVRVEWDDPKRPNRRYVLSSIRFNHEGL